MHRLPEEVRAVDKGAQVKSDGCWIERDDYCRPAECTLRCIAECSPMELAFGVILVSFAVIILALTFHDLFKKKGLSGRLLD